jgi:hypothetical protein
MPKPKEFAEELAKIIAKEAGASVHLDWIDLALEPHKEFSLAQMITISIKIDHLCSVHIRELL